MKYNTAIYQEFYNFAINSLNNDLLSIKEQIYKNSLFRYGNLEDKINVIEELKQDTGTHFNFLRVKGVEYKQGKFQIIETEFKELIDEYRVNLENYNFGLFGNENDNEKPLAYKSYHQVLAILEYCLKLQILNEAKQQLEKPQILTEKFKPNLTIFKNRESHLFFDFLFNDWLKDIEACRPQLSYIVWAMTKEKERETEKEINDYAITCPTLGEFANFWNTYPHIFKLTYKKSKLNLSNDEPSPIHKAPFDNRKKEFKKTLV